MLRRRLAHSTGFIITIELILIFTILVIGTLVGVIAVRNAVFRLVETRLASRLLVNDAADPPLTIKPISFDVCEAPQFLCPDPSNGLDALLGIRPTGLVSRDQIYFTGPGCTGDLYLARPGDSTLPVGYLNALQGVSYGVGPGDFLSPAGRLYRSDGAPTAIFIESRFASLGPDCATLGGGAEPLNLVVNGSFEAPPLDPGERSVEGVPVPSTPTPWVFTAAPSAVSGHQHPCGPGDPLPCLDPIPGPAFTNSFGPGQNVPDSSNTAHSVSALGLLGGPSISQEIFLTPGDVCSLSFWVGCRIDPLGGPQLCPALGGIEWMVEVTSSGGAEITISDTLTSPPTPPEWQPYSGSFVVTGASPYFIELSDGAIGGAPGVGEINYDDFVLSCVTPPVSGSGVCEDTAATELILLPAVEVLNQAATQNILAAYTPLFNVMAPVAPTLTFTEPTGEGGPIGPPVGDQTEDPVTLPPPTPEDG
jgi:hypothetical protein